MVECSYEVNNTNYNTRTIVRMSSGSILNDLFKAENYSAEFKAIKPGMDIPYQSLTRTDLFGAGGWYAVT